MNSKRYLLGASATAAAIAAAPAALGALPADAAAKAPTRAHTRAYEHAYHTVARTLGHQVPGRNIIQDGVAGRRGATDAQTVHSLGVLRRMLAPAPQVTSSTTAATSSAAATTGGSSAGAAGVPACASESGSNYSTGADNTNASSGATGRYQILPSTAAAYGCDLSTATGQDACAGQIYAHQGAGAWVGCGG